MNLAIRFISYKTAVRVACAGFVMMLAAAAFVPSAVAADTPLWTFKGTKWYSLMETGNVTAGMPNGVVMLDGATGKQLWARTDLGEIKEEEYTELPGTPLLLISDNSGWAQRKTKLTAIDTMRPPPCFCMYCQPLPGMRKFLSAGSGEIHVYA